MGPAFLDADGGSKLEGSSRHSGFLSTKTEEKKSVPKIHFLVIKFPNAYQGMGQSRKNTGYEKLHEIHEKMQV